MCLKTSVNICHVCVPRALLYQSSASLISYSTPSPVDVPVTAQSKYVTLYSDQAHTSNVHSRHPKDSPRDRVLATSTHYATTCRCEESGSLPRALGAAPLSTALARAVRPASPMLLSLSKIACTWHIKQNVQSPASAHAKPQGMRTRQWGASSPDL